MLRRSGKIALLLVACVLLGVSCVQEPWEKYQAGPVVLWITESSVRAESECRRRGVDVPYAVNVHGCTDFKTATIVSTKDFRVLAHELCHWMTGTWDHSVCPTPLL